MKKLIGIFIALLIIAISCTSSEKVVETPQLTNYMDTVSYSVGIDIGKSFRLQEMEINPNVMARGLSDAFSDKETAITDEEIQSTLINFRQEFQQKQRELAQQKAQEAAAAEEAYLAESASKEGVVSLPSGLQYKVITPGDGPSPLSSDRVKVHYKGCLLYTSDAADE